MELVATEEFSAQYASLSDAEFEQVAEHLERLESDHETTWARRDRVKGDGTGHWDSAWLIRIPTDTRVFHLYWHYYSEKEIALIGLPEIDT